MGFKGHKLGTLPLFLQTPSSRFHYSSVLYLSFRDTPLQFSRMKGYFTTDQTKYYPPLTLAPSTDVYRRNEIVFFSP